jgi:hypothetical protein
MVHRQICLLFCVLSLLVVAWPAAAQTPAIQLQVEPFYEGKYRPGSWMPLRVTVANDGPDVTALINIQAGTLYETEIDLPRGAQKSLVLYTRPAGTFRSTAVTRVVIKGTESAKEEIQLAPVSSTTYMIGMLTAQPPTVTLPRIGNRRFEAIPLTTRDLPDRTEGLSTFDLILIDGAPLIDLPMQSAQALQDWVLNGGQLIIGGERLSETLAQLPRALQIATVDEPANTGPISLLPEIDNSDDISTTKLVGGTETYSVATVEDEVVGVQREVGNGIVTVLGFSLSAPQLSALPADAQFWQVATRPNAPSIDPMMPARQPGEIQPDQLSFALMQLPALAMPPLSVLGGMLALYLIVIGPGLYFVLRRLDRQAWGWVAIPLATLIFAAGTYGYGLQLRGNDIILNQISIIEPIEGRTRIRSVAGIFSPTTQSYTINTPKEALFRPLSNDMFRGGGPNMSAGGRYMQGSHGIRDLQVAQWSMGSFLAETMENGASLSAELALVDNILKGTISNNGTDPVHDLALIQGSRVTKLGDLRGGETRPVEVKVSDYPGAGWGEPLSMQLLRDKWAPRHPMGFPPELRMHQAVLDSLMGEPFTMRTQPLIIGWQDDAPIDLNLDRTRVQHQSLTLVMLPMNISYNQSETINLPRGWLKPSFETTGQSGGICGTQSGSGWYLEQGTINSTFQLPPGLRSIAVSKTELHTVIDNFAANSVSAELYDWSTNEWIPINTNELSKGKTLDQPASYWGPVGTLKLRITADPEMRHMGTCVSIDVSIEGRVP